MIIFEGKKLKIILEKGNFLFFKHIYFNSKEIMELEDIFSHFSL